MLNRIDLARVDLNLLVLFDAVMAERHVTRAAARLHVSPSAVSHGLGRLRRLLRDPLFLRHPKGVVPTERATALAAGIADVLDRARGIISGAETFTPATSARTFLLMAPEAVIAVLLPPLLARLRRSAPHVRIGTRNLVGRFEPALEHLDRRDADVALVPMKDVPARFVSRPLYDEEFVLVTRKSHPLGTRPTLARYCAAEHLMVSDVGDLSGMVDAKLEALGRTRRVLLSVPNFLLALAVVERSDLVAALQRRFVSTYARQFAVRTARPPLPLGSDPICAVTTRAALADPALAWLTGELGAAAPRDVSA